MKIDSLSPSESTFLKEFENLCISGDNGEISDVVITADAPLYYIKDDKAFSTEIFCGRSIFDKIEKDFAKSPRDDAGPGNYDGSWHFSNFRFRVNRFVTQRRDRAVLRLLPDRIIPMRKLGVPDRILDDLLNVRYGLVLVCGATGSGKSTTISSILDYMSRDRPGHIVTLEDPIEYIIGEGSPSIISQRQVGTDVPDFASGLRAALRQKPNIINVGEIRDSETAATALSAASTGHIVFSTLHTGRAAESVERFVEMLPSKMSYAPSQLADCLQMVICQELLPNPNGGRTPIFEVYRKNDAAKNNIRQGRFNALKDLILTGRGSGCLPMKESYGEARANQLIPDEDRNFD